MKTFALIGIIVFCTALPCLTAATAPEGTPSLPAGTEGKEFEQKIREAELLLDSARKPEEAARIFRDVWNTPAAPRTVKGEALAGLIRCERLLGHGESAASLLRELLDRYADLPSLSRAITELTAGTNASTFISGIEVVGEGQCLDVDRGGVTSSFRTDPAWAPELIVRNHAVSFTAQITPDNRMKGLAQWMSDAEWCRVRTSMGRTAWLQILREGDPATVRFITRISGEEEIPPVPRNVFCLGQGDRIDVHFETSDSFAACRIERLDPGRGPFRVIENAATSPFSDRTVTPGLRYIYRVTGVTENGSHGLPATADATTKTRGIFSGSAKFRGGDGKGFDFLTGKLTAQGGDITLKNIYGGPRHAVFTDYLGIPITCLADRHKPRQTAWVDGNAAMSDSDQAMITSGEPFIVPLRGGGVARCTWRDHEGVMFLHYEVNPDAAHLDFRPALTVEQKGKGAEIRVSPPAGFQVERITVTDYREDGTRTLPVVEGVARDVKTGTNRVVSYSAVGVDRHGRRSATGTAELNLLAGGIRKGETALSPGTAYSFECGRVVPRDEADLFFDSAAGGNMAAFFFAPSGMTGLKRFRDLAPPDRSPATTLDAIVSFDPEKIEFETWARGDEKRPATNTFLLKTRHGGWVKLAIVERGEGARDGVTIRYAFNAREPVLAESDDDSPLVEDEGILFNRQGIEESAKKLLKKITPHAAQQIVTLDGLDKKARTLRAELVAKEGRAVDVAAVFARSYANKLDISNPYTVSTFSFEYATRDDRELTHNDWDIAYGNGGNKIDCCMSSGDRGGIWDLGPIGFDEVDVVHSHASPREVELQAVAGHVYVAHTVDRESDLWARMQIVDIVPGKWMIFRWALIEDDSQVRLLGRVEEKVMTEPVARIQIRAGAGGGNPNQVFLDGTMSIYVDEISQIPLDMTGKPVMEEPSICFVRGGFIPDGMVWEIDTIEIEAQADGDSNGSGEVLVHVGAYPILQIDNPRNGDGPVLFTIDGGARKLKPGERRVRHKLSLPISLVPGDESNLLVEVANSSLCDVTLRGRFVRPGRAGLPTRDRKAELGLRELPRLFLRYREMMNSSSKAGAAHPLRHFAAQKKELLPHLKEIHRAASRAAYRLIIEEMIEEIE
jgi:hypothetical protein